MHPKTAELLESILRDIAERGEDAVFADLKKEIGEEYRKKKWERRKTMKKGLSEKPVLFLILLLIAAFALTAVFVIIFQMIGLEGNLATSVARILAAVMLMILFRNCFPWPNSFRGVRYIIPALIIVVWNVLYNYLSHSTLKPMAEIPGIVLAALAPAMFEESIFRMIGFKKNGRCRPYTDGNGYLHGSDLRFDPSDKYRRR